VHAQLKTLALVLVVLTDCTLVASNPTNAAENPQLFVSVYNDAHVPDDTLTRAEQQATKVFSRAGLDVRWVNCSGRDSASCYQLGETVNLVLRITLNAVPTTSDTAFGVAHLASDGTGRYGDVFWKRVNDLQTNSNAEASVILGSVMAHEMGHLLLGSNAHAVSGIMKAWWQSGELRRIRMGALMFLPEEGKRMRSRVAQETAARKFEEDNRPRTAMPVETSSSATR
jgi:hypothetical protein